MAERRSKKRFALDWDMKFSSGTGRKMTEGAGKVINMSSAGLAFRSSSHLPPNTRVRATVRWPVLLDHQCLLKVLLEGRVIRSDEEISVMSIDTYEFRTDGRASDELKRRMAGIVREFGSNVTPGCH